MLSFSDSEGFVFEHLAVKRRLVSLVFSFSVEKGEGEVGVKFTLQKVTFTAILKVG